MNISKKSAGEKAVDYVEDGMILGLGTGSTVRYTIERLAERIREESLEIVGIPTSVETEKLARSLNIPLSDLNEHPEVDLDIDGADEVDPDFNLIKGGGGAHTREKIVATASKRFIVVVDYNKMVNRLVHVVPIEVFPFCKTFVDKKLRHLGGVPVLREKFYTDNKNIILDAIFEIDNAYELENKLNLIPGVVENGIFSNRKPEIVIVGQDKEVKIINRD